VSIPEGLRKAPFDGLRIRLDPKHRHDIRHEFVSHLTDEGGEIHELKEAARHKDSDRLRFFDVSGCGQPLCPLNTPANPIFWFAD
jgi:hypothetical protein